MVDLGSFLLGNKIRDLTKVKGPLIVWNITSQCNLSCLHCYAVKDKEMGRELGTKEILAAIDDLASIKIPLIIFSGGEPLLRKDIFYISSYAVNKGIRISLSTNGTLIDKEMAKKIKETGINYVGISIDGMSACQDFFRQKIGTFKQNISAIKHCQDLGINTGIRFTISKYNIKELEDTLSLVENLKVNRFCLYHLVYSGRAKDLIQNDLTTKQRKTALDTLIKFTLRLEGKVNVLTVDSPCDGIYLMQKFCQRGIGDSYPGCSAGIRLFNIDEEGLVHPCQFWQDYSFGNIREEKFSAIMRKKDELLMQLRSKQNFLKGKCGLCKYKSVCGGCRVRAKAVYNDVWQEDPDCFLEEKELIGDGRIPDLSAASVA